jgi:hypothetical protein
METCVKKKYIYKEGVATIRGEAEVSKLAPLNVAIPCIPCG